MKSDSESRIDSCVECCVRDRDFSKKKVYNCELCERWFCEKHLEPRLAFIKDLEVIEKIPEIRVLYLLEIKEKEGHPDFEYSRRKFRELKIEERRQNDLIKQALDRMNHYYDDIEIPEKPIDLEAEKKRTVEMLLKEEAEIDAHARNRIPFRVGETTLTYENRYNHHFSVPAEAYSIEKYRQKLNNARTLDEVEHILHGYYKHRPKA